MSSDWRKLDYTEREVELLFDLGLISNSLEGAVRMYLKPSMIIGPLDCETLAKVIEEIADRCTDLDKAILVNLAKAISGEDESCNVKLANPRKGRYRSPSIRFENAMRALDWHGWIAEAEADGQKVESTVAEICERENVGRATVFNALGLAVEYLQLADKVGMKLPITRRPKKSDF